jgi:hypothetical protein
MAIKTELKSSNLEEGRTLVTGCNRGHLRYVEGSVVGLP